MGFEKAERNMLSQNTTIDKRWIVSKRIGIGSFGEIYEAYDRLTKTNVAIKIESNQAKKQMLRLEVPVLKKLQFSKHICRFICFGIESKFSYLVMTLQGRNLKKLLHDQKKHCFTIQTTLRLGIQIFQAIEDIHSIGFLHRDIKPSNFALGCSINTCKILYILDFGLACNQYGISPGNISRQFNGTIRYASVNVLDGGKFTVVDDLWSAFYVLLELRLGKLPWSTEVDLHTVAKIKSRFNFCRLLSQLPQEFKLIFNHLVYITTHQSEAVTPNYRYLRQLLQIASQNHRLQTDNIFQYKDSDQCDAQLSSKKVVCKNTARLSKPILVQMVNVESSKDPRTYHSPLPFGDQANCVNVDIRNSSETLDKPENIIEQNNTSSSVIYASSNIHSVPVEHYQNISSLKKKQQFQICLENDKNFNPFETNCNVLSSDNHKQDTTASINFQNHSATEYRRSYKKSETSLRSSDTYQTPKTKQILHTSSFFGSKDYVKYSSQVNKIGPSNIQHGGFSRPIKHYKTNSDYSKVTEPLINSIYSRSSLNINKNDNKSFNSQIKIKPREKDKENSESLEKIQFEEKPNYLLSSYVRQTSHLKDSLKSLIDDNSDYPKNPKPHSSCAIYGVNNIIKKNANAKYLRYKKPELVKNQNFVIEDVEGSVNGDDWNSKSHALSQFEGVTNGDTTTSSKQQIIAPHKSIADKIEVVKPNKLITLVNKSSTTPIYNNNTIKTSQFTNFSTLPSSVNRPKTNSLQEEKNISTMIKKSDNESNEVGKPIEGIKSDSRVKFEITPNNTKTRSFAPKRSVSNEKCKVDQENEIGPVSETNIENISSSKRNLSNNYKSFFSKITSKLNENKAESSTNKRNSLVINETKKCETVGAVQQQRSAIMTRLHKRHADTLNNSQYKSLHERIYEATAMNSPYLSTRTLPILNKGTSVNKSCTSHSKIPYTKSNSINSRIFRSNMRNRMNAALMNENSAMNISTQDIDKIRSMIDRYQNSSTNPNVKPAAVIVQSHQGKYSPNTAGFKNAKQLVMTDSANSAERPNSSTCPIYFMKGDSCYKISPIHNPESLLKTSKDSIINKPVFISQRKMNIKPTTVIHKTDHNNQPNDLTDEYKHTKVDVAQNALPWRTATLVKCDNFEAGNNKDVKIKSKENMKSELCGSIKPINLCTTALNTKLNDNACLDNLGKISNCIANKMLFESNNKEENDDDSYNSIDHSPFSEITDKFPPVPESLIRGVSTLEDLKFLHERSHSFTEFFKQKMQEKSNANSASIDEGNSMRVSSNQIYSSPSSKLLKLWHKLIPSKSYSNSKINPY